MVVHQAASYIVSNKAEPLNLIQIFPLLQFAPVTFRPIPSLLKIVALP